MMDLRNMSVQESLTTNSFLYFDLKRLENIADVLKTQHFTYQTIHLCVSNVKVLFCAVKQCCLMYTKGNENLHIISKSLNSLEI